jgi:hypothetical protein
MERAMNFKIFNRLQSRQKITWFTRDASSATSRSALLSKSSNAFKCIPNATENVQLPKKNQTLAKSNSQVHQRGRCNAFAMRFGFQTARSESCALTQRAVVTREGGK